MLKINRTKFNLPFMNVSSEQKINLNVKIT